VGLNFQYSHKNLALDKQMGSELKNAKFHYFILLIKRQK